MNVGAALPFVLVLGCASAPRSAAVEPAPAGAPPPAGCYEVAAGTALQPVLDAAAPGSAVCLRAGSYDGPLAIHHAVMLWGAPGAVIRSPGTGTTVTLDGAGAALRGVRIDGSGGRYDQLDAAVRVLADDVSVEGVEVGRATFGILADRVRRLTVRDNHIIGDPTQVLGLRGDAIRLWETRDSLIARNRVEDSRDVVVWYSPGNRIVDNTVVRGRYGTHLMYSHDCVIADNRYIGDVVGVFLMYVHGVRVERNRIADATGAAGMGIGLKDSGDLTIAGNQLVHDTIGVYIDNSPTQLTQSNRVTENRFQLCDQAVVFLSGTARNRFERNAFLDNQADVTVEGGGDAMAVSWDGNYFDDYAGYDLDGDGVGDVAYELRSLQNELCGRTPDLQLLRGTPALALADAAGHLLPLFTPTLVLRDPHPRVRPPEVPDAR